MSGRPDPPKVAVWINGITVEIPKDTPNVYLVEAHTDESDSQKVTDSILTVDVMFAWTWLIETLAERGWGEVTAFDVAYNHCPRWSRSLGRINGPTKHPNPLRHTSVSPYP